MSEFGGTPRVREVEAKFALESFVALRALASLVRIGGYRVASRQKARVRDTYFDTAGFALLSQGCAVRVREVEGRLTLTMKRDVPFPKGRVMVREEIGEPLSAGELSAFRQGNLHSVLAQELGRLTSGEALQEVLWLENDRITFDLVREGRCRFEVALDSVTYHGRCTSGPHPGLEVEVRQAEEGELALVCEALGRHVHLQPSPRSKLQEGLSLTELASVPSTPAGLSAG